MDRLTGKEGGRVDHRTEIKKTKKKKPTLENVNSNTHPGGAGHSSSVLARAELSGRETPAPPLGEGWC